MLGLANRDPSSSSCVRHLHQARQPSCNLSCLLCMSSSSEPFQLQQPEDRMSVRSHLEWSLGKGFQRAENSALDPWSLNLRFWGGPIFSPEAPNPYFEGFRSDLGQKSGVPQTQIQRPRIQRPILGPLKDVTKQKSVKRSVFSLNWETVNEGFGKEFCRQDTSLKRFRQFSERTLKSEVFCAHPLPKSPLLVIPANQTPPKKADS